MQDKIYHALHDAMRSRNLSLDGAAESLTGLIDSKMLQEVVQRIREEGRRNQILEIPGGLENLAYRKMEEEVRHRRWYTGPREGDHFWPLYKESLAQRDLDEDAIEDINKASTKIVSYLGDPGVHGLRTQGLVIGYVQSGKTSNYMGVIAKAADAGYRLIIVLSGMYNSLRQQTQRRLNSQIVEPAHRNRWLPLTREDADFGHVTRASPLLSHTELRLLVVTKKNASRLERVCNWLADVAPEVRKKCPALIIDDEADQATPNTGRNEERRSKINDLVLKLLHLLPTSSYVGYTATPFATVFIDPAAEDLYPSDFIVRLPRPKGYFGAEALFGRAPLDDGDEPDDGYNMVRPVSKTEAASVRPPTNRAERQAFEPPVPDSLKEAIRYFILASAARRCRGQSQRHSSMLVHTTHYSEVHLRQRAGIQGYIDQMKRGVGDTDRLLRDQLSAQWLDESGKVDPGEHGYPRLSFTEVYSEVPDVLRDIKVIADNYISEDRLDYTEKQLDAEGNAVTVPQTVIAVGGNTLSRGLTLEGLVASYFVRSGRAYDTLLQMGRWFGFRPGYEDLPRIWMTEKLKGQFRFLATVEEEIRTDVERYEQENLSPREFGVRIRCHPDLRITSPAKMKAVGTVSLSYSGERLQTFLFKHLDHEWLDKNLEAGRTLVEAALHSDSPVNQESPGRVVLEQVHADRVISFLESYEFHPDHARLRPDLLVDYIQNRREKANELDWWNVAIMGGAESHRMVEQQRVELGRIDLGMGHPIPLINRAPLIDSLPQRADIKALMSRPDRLVDVDIDAAAIENLSQAQMQAKRPPDVGLLLLYPISKHSVPMGVSLKAGSRKPLEAADHVLGVGLVFPETLRAQDDHPSYEYDYVSVTLPDDERIEEEVDDVDPEVLDTEDSATIDFDPEGHDG